MGKNNPKLTDNAAPATMILVVDDHPLMRMALRTVVESRAEWSCCGEAADADSTLQQLEAQNPDLVLLDYYLKSGDGIDLIKEIRRRRDNVKILIISRYSDPEFVERALRAGADGYVIKEESPAQLAEAIALTLKGENYLSQSISGQVIKRMLTDHKDESNDLGQLSDREFQVLQLLAQGLGNKQIAAQLHLSPKTIGTYREHLKEKLGLKDSQQLLMYAARRFDDMAGDFQPSGVRFKNLPRTPRRNSGGGSGADG
ncbi:MAG: DNA-binding NarL/FixJ family response regulator [Limisphaerales bacterium]|jgi:DNA-binding NarL/FixJ family response regulator